MARIKTIPEYKIYIDDAGKETVLADMDLDVLINLFDEQQIVKVSLYWSLPGGGTSNVLSLKEELRAEIKRRIKK